MKRTNRPPFIKALPLLSVFTMGVLFIVCMICINETTTFLPAFATYIDSGQSVFFPDLPRFDLFWFLPQEQQFIPFTWGNIIDILIFINIGLALNKIPYECYRQALESRLQDRIVDLHLDKSCVKYKAAECTTEGKSSIPYIDARVLTGSTAKRETQLIDEYLQPEEIHKGIFNRITRRTPQMAFMGENSTLCVHLASRVSHEIQFSFLVEDSTCSGVNFSSKSFLHSLFQENGVHSS